MTAVYKTGQITLANGSAVVTGVGTAWATMLIAGGIIFPVVGGNPLAIQSVVSNTAITAEKPWAGVSGTYDYVLVRWSADEEQNSVNSSILATIYAELQAGSLWKYDIAGSSADKATYNERPKGFSYLVIDTNPAQLFIKASAASADWAGPFAYATGPQGPVGPAGYVNLRGSYSGATAYAKNDGVLYNGSTFVALQDTTGNAPPTLPTASNAYWQLLAIKGTDGAGTGDVVGPGGATDDMPAFFDGTTGKLLKFKTKTAFKTWLAATAADVAFSNATAALPGAPATVQAAIESLASNSGGKQDAIFALEIADLKGVRMGMNGGIADSFDDETGIATKTNATYDAANDWYSPTTTVGTPTLIVQTDGVIITDFTTRATAQNDGVTNQAGGVSAAKAGGATFGYSGKNYSSSPKRIAQAIVYGSNDVGLIDATNPSVTLTLYGKNGSAPSSGTDGTPIGTLVFTDTTNESAGRTVTSTDTATLWDYVWVYISKADTNTIYLAELQLYAVGGTLYGPSGGSGGGAYNSGTGVNVGGGTTSSGYGGGAGGGAGAGSGSAGAGAVGSPGLILIQYTPSGGSQKTLALLTGSSWQVPSDWNNASNIIACLGGSGGSGAGSISGTTGGNGGAGGGGGGFSSISNTTLTPGSNITYQIGAAGAIATAGGDTWFNGANLAAASVGAKGGNGGANAAVGSTAAVGGTGGASASGIGTTKFSGGNGGNGFVGVSSGACGGGGGGAAGPNGNGGNGSNGFVGTSGGGGGGGANGGATATTAAGGNGRGGTGGGTTASPGNPGTAGTGGGGGGANAANVAQANLFGGAGAQENVWTVPPSILNMTLVSVTYVSATVPGTARISLQLAGSTAFTPNTDFTMEVSRDGGTTWTTAVLALTVDYGGVKMYEATVSLSAQPSGSNMVWRMRSLTNKNVIASGVVLQQS